MLCAPRRMCGATAVVAWWLAGPSGECRCGPCCAVGTNCMYAIRRPPPPRPPRPRAPNKAQSQTKSAGEKIVCEKRRRGGGRAPRPAEKPARVQQYSHERPRTRDKTGRAAGRAARRRTSCVGGGRRARIAHIAHRAPGLTARCSTVTVRPNHSHSRQDDASRTVPRRHHARPGRGYIQGCAAAASSYV